MITLNKSGTVALTANGVSQNAALPLCGGELVALYNTGPQMAFVEFSADANLPTAVPSGATAGGFPIAANQPAEYVRLKEGDTRISYISAGNSALFVARCKKI